MRYLTLLASFVLIFAGCASEPAETYDSAAEDSAAEDSAATTEAAGESTAGTEELCLDAGPQTPRDIANKHGLNTNGFDRAPAATAMNLCNIHTHTNAEHKGPGFSVFVNDSDYGGYACNETADLSEAELEPLEGAYGKVKSGDTIEVHWVHSSCDVAPGEGLASCVTDVNGEPCGEDTLLRVEAQVFLVVNDENALDFAEFAAGLTERDGFHQAPALPTGTGEPVEFLGSTTGPKFNQSECSPAEVTWSVRPNCAKLDIASLHRWAESNNVFAETKSHGVRQLVVAPELLSEIE